MRRKTKEARCMLLALVMLLSLVPCITPAANAAGPTAIAADFDNSLAVDYGQGVSFDAVPGQEYVLVEGDGSPDWSKPVVPIDGKIIFAELTPGEKFTVYTRVAATDDASAGEAAATSFVTSVNAYGWFGNAADPNLIGSTVTASFDAAAELSYQWFLCDDEAGANVSSITGETDADFLIPEELYGKYFFAKAYIAGIEVGEFAPIGPVSYMTVTFDSNGGSEVESISGLVYGDAVEQPEEPTRSGFSFGGWYCDEEFTELWDFGKDAAACVDLILYAEWTDPDVPIYISTITEDENGFVSVNPRKAASGSSVEIDAYPFDGYEVDTVSVAGTECGDVAVVKNDDGTYSFTQPAEAVTVTVTFKETENSSDNPFSDVAEEDYYYDAVLWAYANGITVGSDETSFSPDQTCTRAQMVTFLWRAANMPEPFNDECPFEDVHEDAYYYKAVLWAYNLGINARTDGNTFSPDDTVTRAQSVTFLFRALGTAVSSYMPFTDVDPDAYYYYAVLWAARNGITTGVSLTTFGPENDCLRAQIVTFLYRAYAGRY